MKKNSRGIYVAGLLASIAAASSAGNAYRLYQQAHIPASFVTEVARPSAQTTDANESDATIQDEPTDLSDKIVNATFDTKGDESGWTLTHNNGSNHAEVKNGVVTGRAFFDLRQTITGLTPGRYKITAQVFTRPDDNDKVWEAIQKQETPINKTYLYANDVRVLCPLITSEASTATQSGWTHLEGLGYVPNSSGQVAKAFELGMYKVEVMCIVGTDGVLTFGVTNEYDEWACYAGADNFKLFYLGEANTISQDDINALLETVPTGAMERTVRETLDEAIAALKADPTTQTYEAATTAIQAAKQSAEAYATVAAAIKKADNESLSDEARTIFDTEVKSIADGYNEGTLTGDCTNEVAAIEAALTKAKIYDAEQSNDLTSLITNPQFDDGTKGWSGNFGNGAKKGTADNYVITCFASGFDVYQKITGLKPGTYKLKAQAFSRPKSNDEVWAAVQAGQSVANETYLYANNKEKLVPLIVDDYETQKPGTGAWSSYTLNGKAVYVPNDSKAFSVAFADGLYDNELKCFVGEDGVLTFGIKNLDDANGTTYAGFDNFRLTYVSPDSIDDDPAPEATRTDSIARAETYNLIAAQATDHTAFDAIYATAIEQMKAEDASPATVSTAYAKIVEAFQSLVKNGTTENGQFNFTPLLGNADFTQNADGWQKSGGNIRWNAIGAMVGSNIKGGAKLYQTLKDMPAGKYTLKVQGFYCPEGWKQALYNYEHNVTDPKLHLFMNDRDTLVKSIFTDARNLLASACVSRREDVGATIDGRGYPLLIDEKINEAFEPGAYWNYVEAEVTEDGTVRLGIELDPTELSNNRLAIDNFRLYYGERKQVTLNSGKVTLPDDDTPCEVSIKKALTAGSLNPFSAPCDIPGSRFKAVYEIGGIDAGSRTAMVYPVEKVRAGVPCYVEVEQDIDSIYVGPTVLKATKPDRLPFPWDGGCAYAVYNNMAWRSVLTKGTTVAPSYFKDIEKQKLEDLHFDATIENMQVSRFLTTDYSLSSSSSVVSTYNVPVPARRDVPHAIGIPLPQSLSEGATLIYSEREDMAEATSIPVAKGANVCYIPNLIPGHKYYAVVQTSTNEPIVKAEFNVTGQLRFLYAPSVYNLRDLGGWSVSDGRTVRYGLIYRGGEVNGAHPAIASDLETLKALGIGAEVDLRYNDSYDMDRETNKSGYGFVHGQTYYFAGSNWFTADHIADANCQAQMREEFEFILKNIREGRGVHFHCAFGADRTGFLAVLLEGLLGLDSNQMCHEYELTSFAAPAGNRNKSTILNIIQAVRNNSTGSTLRDQFENYWIEKCKVSKEDIEEFRSLMLEKSTATGIGSPAQTNDAVEIESVYNLQGMKVDNSALHTRPGIYIIKYTNGATQKVIAK